MGITDQAMQIHKAKCRGFAKDELDKKIWYFGKYGHRHCYDPLYPYIKWCGAEWVKGKYRKAKMSLAQILNEAGNEGILGPSNDVYSFCPVVGTFLQKCKDTTAAFHLDSRRPEGWQRIKDIEIVYKANPAPRTPLPPNPGADSGGRRRLPARHRDTLITISTTESNDDLFENTGRDRFI